MDTEDDFRAPERADLWRGEPFRIFFPLGVVLAWLGIGHWLAYTTGLSGSYSCQLHGLVQTEAFLIAFAIGFLFTAVPRRTGSAPPSMLEIAAAALALTLTAVATLAGYPAISQLSYVFVFALMLRFALRRFGSGSAKRRPPAAFVLIPIAIAHGVIGAVLTAGTPALHAWPFAIRLGPLLVEQGVFLCLTIGVGSLIAPLMGGSPPPADLGASSRETAKLLGYAAVGVLLFATFVLEAAGWSRIAPLGRASVDGLALFGSGALRRPGKPGLHRQYAWAAMWMMPVGLAVSGMVPDLRVPALHVLFIGGFGLLAFAVATHVSLTHLDLEPLALGRPPAVVVLGTSFALALGARVAADVSHTYFAHLGWAAGSWIVGSATWLVFLGPRLLRPLTAEPSGGGPP
jgi:uncharacterized protein involved in response to NO